MDVAVVAVEDLAAAVVVVTAEDVVDSETVVAVAEDVVASEVVAVVVLEVVDVEVLLVVEDAEVAGAGPGPLSLNHIVTKEFSSHVERRTPLLPAI